MGFLLQVGVCCHVLWFHVVEGRVPVPRFSLLSGILVFLSSYRRHPVLLVLLVLVMLVLVSGLLSSRARVLLSAIDNGFATRDTTLLLCRRTACAPCHRPCLAHVGNRGGTEHTNAAVAARVRRQWSSFCSYL